MKFYVVGDVTVDHICFLERIPQPGDEIAPTRSFLMPGGAGGTMAYYLASLGHEVILAACVGQDAFQDVALSKLKEVGVKLDALQEDEHTLTSTIMIMITPNAERAMISYGGANRNLDAAKLKRKDLESADALLVSAYAMIGGLQREFAIKAIAAAKKADVPVFIDLGGAINVAGTKLLDNVKAADYLLLNQLEILHVTGKDSLTEALVGLHDQGLQTVVIKVGAMGSVIWTPEESELLEGYEIEGILDSTGAGDAFTSAFAHAILEGLSPDRAARYANIAGALVATQVGAQSTRLNHKDILARLRR